VSRIFDVTLGTLRIIFVSRGKKHLAPILGFFEVFIWIIAISQIMQNLNNFLCYIAYAGGFAMGNFIGLAVEEKLAIGIQMVRIIVPKDEACLKQKLSDAGYGVTVVDGQGANGEVKIIYTIVKRKSIEDVLKIINECAPKAFYSIEDARTVTRGVFPEAHRSNNFELLWQRLKHK